MLSPMWQSSEAGTNDVQCLPTPPPHPIVFSSCLVPSTGLGTRPVGHSSLMSQCMEKGSWDRFFHTKMLVVS